MVVVIDVAAVAMDGGVNDGKRVDDIDCGFVGSMIELLCGV